MTGSLEDPLRPNSTPDLPANEVPPLSQPSVHEIIDHLKQEPGYEQRPRKVKLEVEGVSYSLNLTKGSPSALQKIIGDKLATMNNVVAEGILTKSGQLRVLTLPWHGNNRGGMRARVHFDKRQPMRAEIFDGTEHIETLERTSPDKPLERTWSAFSNMSVAKLIARLKAQPSYESWSRQVILEVEGERYALNLPGNSQSREEHILLELADKLAAMDNVVVESILGKRGSLSVLTLKWLCHNYGGARVRVRFDKRKPVRVDIYDGEEHIETRERVSGRKLLVRTWSMESDLSVEELITNLDVEADLGRWRESVYLEVDGNRYLLRLPPKTEKVASRSVLIDRLAAMDNVVIESILTSDGNLCALGMVWTGTDHGGLRARVRFDKRKPVRAEVFADEALVETRELNARGHLVPTWCVTNDLSIDALITGLKAEPGYQTWPRKVRLEVDGKQYTLKLPTTEISSKILPILAERLGSMKNIVVESALTKDGVLGVLRLGWQSCRPGATHARVHFDERKAMRAEIFLGEKHIETKERLEGRKKLVSTWCREGYEISSVSDEHAGDTAWRARSKETLESLKTGNPYLATRGGMMALYFEIAEMAPTTEQAQAFFFSILEEGRGRQHSLDHNFVKGRVYQRLVFYHLLRKGEYVVPEVMFKQPSLCFPDFYWPGELRIGDAKFGRATSNIEETVRKYAQVRDIGGLSGLCIFHLTNNFVAYGVDFVRTDARYFTSTGLAGLEERLRALDDEQDAVPDLCAFESFLNKLILFRIGFDDVSDFQEDYSGLSSEFFSSVHSAADLEKEDALIAAFLAEGTCPECIFPIEEFCYVPETDSFEEKTQFLPHSVCDAIDRIFPPRPSAHLGRMDMLLSVWKNHRFWEKPVAPGREGLQLDDFVEEMETLRRTDSRKYHSVLSFMQQRALQVDGHSSINSCSLAANALIPS